MWRIGRNYKRLPLESFVVKIIFFGALAILIFCFSISILNKNKLESKEIDLVAVSVLGVHHLGYNYSIPEFYINKYGGSGIQREGGGSGVVCCVMIPKVWRPGLSVQVRWKVEDWSQEDRSEIEAGDFSSVTLRGIYIAQVPIEKYEKTGDLYLHFFSEAKVRIFPSLHSPLSSLHPVPYGEFPGGTNATSGERVKEIFSDAEKKEIVNRRNPWK